MAYKPLHGMPAHELLQRAKCQGLWPIPKDYHAMATDDIIKALAYDTGNVYKYVKATLNACRTCDPGNWPSLYVEHERVTVDLTAHGKGRFNNKPNPVVRRGIAKSARVREEIIKANDKMTIRQSVVPIRTNAGQLERVQDHAPVLTNGRMRPNSKQTTAYSTGYAPPSRKDDTRVNVKQTGVYRRWSKT